MKQSYPAVTFLALVASIAFTSHGVDAADGKRKTGELKPSGRAPEQPPKDTPDAAARNLLKLKLPAGFTADLWAGEPLLANPVAFCFDPKGRIFVSETHRLRSSTVDIRDYMFMLEDDLATRNQDDWMASIKKNLPKDWQSLSRETEIVRLLEDSDGDGKADKSSIYADGFNSALDGVASGVLWHDDELYFTNIPALWKLTGKNKAEKREEMLRGFGIRFSYTGHDLHGLIVGPDQRLYFTIGDRAASVKTKEGTTLDLPDEGGAFRCELDGSHLELVMRGLRNPQELAFDDYGNLFTADNDSDQGDRERWVYIVEGADAGWRIGWQHHPLGSQFNPWLAEKMWEPRDRKKKQPAFIISPIANLPDGPSGLVHNPGTGMPVEFAGSFFLAGFRGSTSSSTVSTFKSTPSGATFKLEGLHTFMDHVQATDVGFGPDSRFYVSAWDEGWERSDQGRIIRLSHEAARKEQAGQIAEVEKLMGEGFAQRKSEELIQLLGHADQRVRLGAQWVLGQRVAGATPTPEAQQAIKLLADTTRTGVPGAGRLSRLHAIWAMGQGSRFASADEMKRTPGFRLSAPKDEGVRALFDDHDAEVRGQFLKAMADTPAPFAVDLIQIYTTKLADSSTRVRFFAAMALAKKGDASMAIPVVQMLKENDAKDEYLQHAGIMALAASKNDAVLQSAAQDESRALRQAALLAYRQLGSERVAQFLTDKDAALVSEAAHAINDVPIAAAMPALARLALDADGKPLATDNQAYALRVLNANFRVGDTESAHRLSVYAADATAEPLRLVALEMLAHWGTPPARDYVVGTYRSLHQRGTAPAASALTSVATKLLGDRSEKVVFSTCDALAVLKVKAAAPQLLAVVQNTKAPTKDRLAALDALSGLGTSELAIALTVAAADPVPAIKTEASKLFGKIDPSTSAKQLIASFTSAELAQKRQILTALGDNLSAEAGQAIAALVADIARVPMEAQVELLEAAAKRPEAKDALAQYEAALPRNDPMTKFLPALTGGDAAAGEKIFKEHAVAACMRCHKVGNVGGDAGPALDGIATRKDRRYILESIVNVNAAIADGFQMVVLTMKDDTVAAGFLKKESESDLTVQTPTEAQAKIYKKADIKQRDTAPSGMLPNLADLLTKRELRDIMEYCATLK